MWKLFENSFEYDDVLYSSFEDENIKSETYENDSDTFENVTNCWEFMLLVFMFPGRYLN